MKRYNIALIPGDGIGPEQMRAAVKVIRAVEKATGLKFNLKEVEAGDRCKTKTGTPLPDETIDVIKRSHTCLKAPVGETAAEVIVRLRQMLDLYANVRPAKAYPGIPCARPDIDFVIARENTEGVYKGIELRLSNDATVCLRVITRRASERIAKFAFEMAKSRGGKKRVTAVHKANVMRVTCGLFAKVCRKVAKSYPDVRFDEMYVDAAAMRLIREPEKFDVIVTTNLFGDILSDEAAQLVGGLGVSPSANVGDDLALFEPVHGSAPDIAGKGIANPCSLILASKMMFEWLGRRHNDPRCDKAAGMVERAMIETLNKGIRTPDLGGKSKTMEVGEAIAKVIIGG